MEGVIETIVPNASSKTKSNLRFVAGVVLVLLLVFVGYYIYVRSRFNMTTVKSLVSEAAAPYQAQASMVETILLQGVYEIVNNPFALRQATDYGKAMNLPVERVIVDNAIAMAKELQYIA